MSEVAFFGWWLPPGRTLVTSGTTTDGRLTASFRLAAADLDDPSDTVSRAVSYQLHGPRDVTALERGSVVRTYPSRGAMSVELDKAVYAELAAADLPWRYTVDMPSGRALRPWMTLVVGTSDEIDVAGNTVRLAPSALDAHPLTGSARNCHVEQDDAGRAISRLMSLRALEPDRDDVAVVVPAFESDGDDAWPTPAARALETAAYDHWTFHTRNGGDFGMLARRLRPRPAPAHLGAAEVSYSPLPDEDPTLVGGALVAPSAAPSEPLPDPVVADVTAITELLGDAAHPVLSLPDLAGPWPLPTARRSPANGWRADLRRDHRVRGVAGLGVAAAIAEQEMLVREAGRLAGAHQEVADRLRRLALGLLVSRSLWKRRVPTDPTSRLAVLGPALRNVLTADGPVSAAMRRDDRAIEAGLFSSAARRVLRPRADVRTEAAAATVDVGSALAKAAAAPSRLRRSVAGSLHTDVFARARRIAPLDDALIKRPPRTNSLAGEVAGLTSQFTAELAHSNIDRDTARFLGTRLTKIAVQIRSNRPIAILPLLGLVDDIEPRKSRDRLRSLGEALSAAPDSDDIAALGERLAVRPEAPIATRYDIANAGRAVADAFDPTTARPSMIDRVLSGLTDVAGATEAAPLHPVELTPDLDLPAWKFLRDNASEWLLPSADSIEADSVVALTTNPAFVDAFLLGLNAQIVSELRFRNLPLIPGWTPVRTFWDRANSATGGGEDDIVDISDWTPASAFGGPTHQTPSASSVDLVVLFASPIFREYPGTLVYLVPATRKTDGTLDWVNAPDLSSAQFPTFQGRVGPDRHFVGFDLDPALAAERWVVLEETVNGRRFVNESGANVPASVRDGAEVARRTLSPPRRVLIRGDRLLGGGT